MKQWWKANGGPGAVVILGLALTGFTNRNVGLAVIALGVLGLIVSAIRHRRQGEEPQQAPAAGPDVRIHDLKATGGASDYVDFTFSASNYGTRSCRASVVARVDGQDVGPTPQTLELIANAPQQSVRVIVARPALGTLVPALGNETTLYGRTLEVQLVGDDGSVLAEAAWKEHVYSLAENSERHEIQQREWRFGRGEHTPQDDRADRMADLLRRHTEQYDA